MTKRARRVPYFRQWNRELTSDVLTRGAASALAEESTMGSTGCQDDG